MKITYHTINTISFILLFLSLYLFSLATCNKKFLQKREELSKKDKIKLGESVLKYQVGRLNSIPDGPMTEQELNDFISSDKQKREGNPTKVGVVYIDKKIASMPVGQMRIKPKNIVLFFPDDYEDIKNYQNEDDNYINKRDKHDDRIKLEREILNDAENHPSSNPYQEIYEREKESLDYESDVKPDVHKKNLLNLAVEKEEEIFRRELKYENEEYFDKKFNKAFYNNVYKFRNYWQESNPQPEEEEIPEEPIITQDPEVEKALKPYEIK